MNPRYSIGIDLGTTNCALAYVDLSDAEGESQVLGIRQLETASTEVERSALPSFLYLGDNGNWVGGLHARERGREVPERVIHSAKSWLCHHSVSPEAPILPWKSKAVPDVEKLSPIATSARLLEVLKEAWERQFGRDAPFVEQAITVTVPASFDAAAQAATMQAAKLAGYPEGVRLLEEPQAAFYRWLESAGEDAKTLRKGERILVVDIGGGTSDFSLFEVGALEDGRPKIERVSVSEHLLLGGDNIDLALAHALETELAPRGEELSVDQWGHLISRARELKETCLSEDEDRLISVSLPSKGAGLFAGTLSTEVSSRMARDLILEGFFPECPVDATAERSQGGLLEIGLPYAVDCAVTRHLAEFLGNGPGVDRILFNGGSLSAKVIQERLLGQFGKWQGGREPTVLNNTETDLAVARGAACYGASLERGVRQIDAGAARGVFLRVASGLGGGSFKWVCVLPEGAQPGSTFSIEIAGLTLAVNQSVRFEVAQGPQNSGHQAGDWFEEGVESLRVLPAFETFVESPGQDVVPVRLCSVFNELGLLTVYCEAIGADSLRWPLAFNLRGDSQTNVNEASWTAEAGPGFDRQKVEAAASSVKGRLLARGSKPKASQLFRLLEAQLGEKKHNWSIGICRCAMDTVFGAEGALSGDASAAASWLQLSGYLMRPGFGVAGDEERVKRLMQALDEKDFLRAQVEVQQLILLRRIAAGLPECEQGALFDRHYEFLKIPKGASDERIRLLANLQKVDLARKEALFEAFSNRLEELLSGGGHVSALLDGLGSLLSRVLFRTGPDRVLPAERVESLFEKLKREDWTSGRFTTSVPLFLKAARQVDDRRLNLSSRSIRKVVTKLEKSGVSASRLLPLRDFVHVTFQDRVDCFGESLPPGLLLQ